MRRWLTTVSAFLVAVGIASSAVAANSSHRWGAAVPQKATLQSFAGVWGGHDRGLSITRLGKAYEQIQAGCCCPCLRLWYRLSKPVGTTDFAAATITVTAVRAPAKGGRVPAWGYSSDGSPPPQVGQRGTIQLKDGVILNNLTWTNYCRFGLRVCGA